MELKKFSTILSLILLSSLLAGCGLLPRTPEPKVVTVTQVVKPKIDIASRPKPLNLNDVQFYVVTGENFNEFKEKFIKENNQLVFIALSVRDYEILAVNLAELRRYLLQQKEIIVYYENSIEKQLNTKEEKKEEKPAKTK